MYEFCANTRLRQGTYSALLRAHVVLMCSTWATLSADSTQHFSRAISRWHSHQRSSSHRSTGREQEVLAPPIRVFNFLAIIKIRADAVCCIHVSTVGYCQISQSLSVICSPQMPDFSAKMHQIKFRLGLDRPDPAPKIPSLLGGAGCLLYPPSLSALRASIFVLFRAKLPQPPKILVPHACACSCSIFVAT